MCKRLRAGTSALLILWSFTPMESPRGYWSRFWIPTRLLSPIRLQINQLRRILRPRLKLELHRPPRRLSLPRRLWNTSRLQFMSAVEAFITTAIIGGELASAGVTAGRAAAIRGMATVGIPISVIQVTTRIADITTTAMTATTDIVGMTGFTYILESIFKMAV